MNRTGSHLSIALLGLLVLLAAPVLAGDPSPQPSKAEIGPGFDYWQTVGSGATAYNFKNNPLPADFFCKGSKPFGGLVALEGVPLETDPPRALGTTDTIIERLDTVEFDKTGFGTTRIRVRALDLESRDVIETACGDWSVRATLAKGDQPTTQMALQRSNTCASTGVFTAELELDVNLSFVHAGTGKTISIDRQFHLPIFSEEQFTIGDSACRAKGVPVGQSVLVKTASHNFQVDHSDAFAAGCACNCDGTVCLPLLPEHEAFDDERHFTVPPCEYFGNPCENEIGYVTAVDSQLKVLKSAGMIDEPVTEALGKIVNKNF